MSDDITARLAVLEAKNEASAKGIHFLLAAISTAVFFCAGAISVQYGLNAVLQVVAASAFCFALLFTPVNLALYVAASMKRARTLEASKPVAEPRG
ncbi:MAG: hypothetical protein F4X83_00115 [Chloroflexi bacterium]|nr:hypothetical protein [Chloroflexota bacterium]